MDRAPLVRSPLAAAGQVTFLPTADLAAVDAFYGVLLGLPLVRDQGVCRIYETSPGAYLGFCDRGYAVPDQFRVVLTLIVEDVVAAHDVLLARGATPEGPPAHSDRYAVTSFFVRDPNGYLLELQRFDVPLPATGAPA
jgi:catechol 2,3-dioxygenase-like lactoylglutathione lyase family enzyme